jgi:hypothetical protein
MNRILQIWLALSLSVVALPIFSQILDAPQNIAAALLIKLSAFEKTISSTGDVMVYVLGAPDVASELQKVVGQSIGQSRLAKVKSGENIPAEKPDILYIGKTSKLTQAIAYTRNNKILSITGMPNLVMEGVTLGIGVGSDGRPKVVLNLSSTVEENLTWNPAIMKIARIIK